MEITQELEIVGIYEIFPGNSPWESYSNIICKDFLPSLDISYFRLLINYDSDDVDIGALNDRVKQAMNKINPSIQIYSAYNEETDQLFSLLSFLDIEKYYFLILVAIGIAITMYNSIQEKSLDFGILRARGVDRWTIVKTQLSEGLVYLTLGSIISLNGIFSAFALNNAIENIIGSLVPRKLIIPIWKILIELGSSILIFSIIIVLSSLLVLRQSNVKKISEVFRTA